MFDTVFRFTKYFIFFICICLIVLFSCYNCLDAPAGKGLKKKDIVLENDSALSLVSEILEKNDIIKSDTFLNLYADLNYDDDFVKKGSYIVNDGLRTSEIVDILLGKRVKFEYLTIPDGYNTYEIALLLEERGLVSKEVFLNACRDTSALSKFDVKSDTVEGFLLPGRYYFQLDSKPKHMIQKMILEFFRNYNPEAEKVKQSLDELGLTFVEWVTMASLIEEETIVNYERNLIAAVIYNRLKNEWYLETLSSLKYGLKLAHGWEKEYKFSVKDDFTKFETPYNTFVKSGLPPAPITNPGKKSLNVALKPPKRTYMYYDPKDDKTHYFSSDEETHTKNLEKYYSWLESQKE